MEEEIDLAEYFAVLIKRKKLIVWITLLTMLFAGIMNYFVIKPVYKGEATLLLPKVGNSPILSAKEVESLMESEDFENAIAKKIDLPFESLSQGFSFSKSNSPNFVKLTFQNHSKEKIMEFFNALLNLSNERTKEFYDTRVNALKTKLALLKNQLSDTEAQFSLLEKTLNETPKNSSSKAESMLEYSFLLNTYNSVLHTKMSLESQISSINIQLAESNGFKCIGEPFVENRPVKPKKLFNIAVSGVVAFFFAILLAFLLEYQEGMHKNSKEAV